MVKSALGDNDGGTRRTTAVSRAWRRSAKWLTVLAGQPTQQQRRAAINRLRYYKHPAPRIGGATPQQEKGFASFEAWKTLLTEQARQLSIWVEVLKEWAVKNAEAEERAAQQAALCKWTNWIHDGPASGLRRQHCFSRGTQGWTATRKSSGGVQPFGVEDELEDIDGLSQEELEALKFEQAIANPLATAQQQADDEAEA